METVDGRREERGVRLSIKLVGVDPCTLWLPRAPAARSPILSGYAARWGAIDKVHTRAPDTGRLVDELSM
jgi:hypothetical protein